MFGLFLRTPVITGVMHSFNLYSILCEYRRVVLLYIVYEYTRVTYISIQYLDICVYLNHHRPVTLYLCMSAFIYTYIYTWPSYSCTIFTVRPSYMNILYVSWLFVCMFVCIRHTINMHIRTYTEAYTYEWLEYYIRTYTAVFTY